MVLCKCEYLKNDGFRDRVTISLWEILFKINAYLEGYLYKQLFADFKIVQILGSIETANIR